MVRELSALSLKSLYYSKYPDLNKDFIFAVRGFNSRPTEFNGILGSNQILNLDFYNIQRSKNLIFFLRHLNSRNFFVEFKTYGNSNYALPLILKTSNLEFRRSVEDVMRKLGIEFRRGLSGGGSQIRQVYLKKSKVNLNLSGYKVTDYVHFFGYYIGNYPNLNISKIKNFCKKLNNIKL
jgi:CDP-4-dehydro-6-deoxyglucose reductase, E1